MRRLTELLHDPQGSKDAKELLGVRLPSAFGLEMSATPTDTQVQAVLREFERCYEQLSNFADRRAMSLVGQLVGIFGGAGHTRDDLRHTINDWYNSLTDSQRLHRFPKEAGALQAAAESDKRGRIDETMLVTLPERLGLGAYTTWTEGLAEELFLAKVDSAKKTIENYKPEPPPEPLTPPLPPDGPEEEKDRKLQAVEAKVRIRELISVLPSELRVQVLRDLLQEFGR